MSLATNNSLFQLSNDFSEERQNKEAHIRKWNLHYDVSTSLQINPLPSSAEIIGMPVWTWEDSWNLP